MSEAPPTPTPTVGPGLVGVVVVVLVAVLAGTWAATVGPRDVLQPGSAPIYSERGSDEAEQPTGSDDQGSGEGTAREGEGREAPAWLRALGRATQIAIAAALVYFGLRWLLRQRFTFRRRRIGLAAAEPPPEFEVPEEEDPDLIAEAIAKGASEQRAELATGSPRNAIVACWHRFEVAANATGVARHRWETPTEFIRRMLALVSADEDAVATLAGLYREARFSDHPLGEGARRQAEDALATIHRTLRAGVGRA